MLSGVIKKDMFEQIVIKVNNYILIKQLAIPYFISNKIMPLIPLQSNSSLVSSDPLYALVLCIIFAAINLFLYISGNIFR